MCGRFTLTRTDPGRLASRFDLPSDFEIDERPRFNIAPTDPVLAIRRSEQAKREAGRLRWGLVPGRWAQKSGQRPLINARVETVATQPAFKESFAERRCLIPADGFYEWRKDPDGKQPIWAHRADGELFSFAGLWASLSQQDDKPLVSCTLITCEPNATMRSIHNRMPVLLDPGLEEAWLDPDASTDDLLDLLVPAPDDLLEIREVGDSVNDVRKDGPELLEPPMKLF